MDAQVLDPARPRWLRGALGGVVGLLAGYAVAFPLLLLVGPATVFNSEIQSPKIGMAWELEPLPLMISDPAAFAVVLAVLGAVHGLAFAGLERGLPKGRLRRGLAYGLVLFGLSFLFAELLFPFSILREPLPLLGVELATAVPGALVEGLVISAIYGIR